jgi:hypothetical protein
VKKNFCGNNIQGFFFSENIIPIRSNYFGRKLMLKEIKFGGNCFTGNNKKLN